jgi:hypothetical protein
VNRRRAWLGAAGLVLVASAGSACSSSSPSSSPSAAAAAPTTSAGALATAASGPAATPSPSSAPATCGARFLGLGDSIAAQSIGPATDRLRDMGFATHLDVRWGTGPLDHDPDWVAVAERLQADFQPTVVLAVFYGNYSQPIDGVAPDSPAEYERWGDRVAELTRVFTDAGARVVWLQPPPRPEGTVSPTWDATVAAVSALPGVSFRPTGALVAGPDGRWTQALRDPDGVHLTRDGGDRMAADIVEAALEISGC